MDHSINDSNELYSSLDLKKHSIRLLRLTSNDGCYLESCNIDEAPSYFALSYAWKESSDKPGHKYVFIRHKGSVVTVKVQYNLWSFLNHVSDLLGPEIYLWIDFICINQNDTHERNHQVSIMQNIYGKATGVLAWLGERESKPLLEKPHLDEILDTDLERWRDRDELLRNAASVGSREYWTRLWIIQEFLVNSSLMLCLGRFSISFEQLLDEYCVENRHRPGDKTHACLFKNDSANCVYLFRLRIDYRSDEKLTMDPTDAKKTELQQLVSRTARFRCAEPKDKIYGLLGLCSTSILVPDYSISVERLCIDWLAKEKHQDALGMYNWLAELKWISHDNLRDVLSRMRENKIRFRVDLGYESKYGAKDPQRRAEHLNLRRFVYQYNDRGRHESDLYCLTPMKDGHFLLEIQLTGIMVIMQPSIDPVDDSPTFVGIALRLSTSRKTSYLQHRNLVELFLSIAEQKLQDSVIYSVAHSYSDHRKSYFLAVSGTGLEFLLFHSKPARLTGDPRALSECAHRGCTLCQSLRE